MKMGCSKGSYMRGIATACLIVPLVAFTSKLRTTSTDHTLYHRGVRSHICMQNDKLSDLLREKLSAQEFSEAYNLLKRNPMLKLGAEDARVLLNNCDKLDPTAPPLEQLPLKSASQDPTVFLYRRLERQKLLRGFGCINGEYPEPLSEVSPARLEELTGLNIAALTPKERTTYWRLAGILLVIVEFIFGSSIGVDPLITLIPGTFLLLSLDQLLYRGAFFESAYRKVFPEYGQKIVYHEAGHLLLAYLLGVPIKGYVTSAWDARKYADIKGQAGTIFYDAKLSDEISNQQVTRTSIDRLSVVIMAGIAAEALKFGRAEGGAADEQSIIQFLTSIQPPWNILRIQGQARWAAVQAILLIREHQQAYDALVAAMESGKPTGDVISIIEDNLPKELPSQRRIDERERIRKKRDSDNLLRYIQKLTYSVGGIMPPETNESDATVSKNGPVDAETIKKEPSLPDAEANALIDQYADKMLSLELAVKSGDLEIPSEDSAGSNEGRPDPLKGGIWLNSLDSLKNQTSKEESSCNPTSSQFLLDEAISSADVSPVPTSSSDLFGSLSPKPLQPPMPPMPVPKEGFEKAIEDMIAANGGVVPLSPAEQEVVEEDPSETASSTVSTSTTTSQVSPRASIDTAGTTGINGSASALTNAGIFGGDGEDKGKGRGDGSLGATSLNLLTPRQMLESHRGFQMKQLELRILNDEKNVEAIRARLAKVEAKARTSSSV